MHQGECLCGKVKFQITQKIQILLCVIVVNVGVYKALPLLPMAM
ncbi:hypothetical protein [uncultured Gammaproteobacteria bacterium]|uniref:Uncharacterized protein n=1 Tax=Bathymodiolus azoricus thioautotrophic gill symbiont TaxID=235205 RepID=A0ACA8ZS33_9GAMM|nr:hypothetical protein AZO1586R_1496 [Bathymodiolus azoricus thioautotrophic gill symbiont]CAC5842204.1 hypothetical protein [uncultured Gammaproteobacteria bacterium]CAC9503586.1 hypothetical protein [uncultured Gammaproteobacteria bacterium]